MSIEVGSKVMLKSGGPEMTVKEIDGKKVNCTWFDKSGKITEHEFAIEQLEEYNIGDIMKNVLDLNN